MADHPSKQSVLDVMRRLGMQAQIPEAERLLPDPVDVQRDGDLLARFGLGVDAVINDLGGSP
jgi:hypothetical protein